VTEAGAPATEGPPSTAAGWLAWLLPPDPESRALLKQRLLQVLIACNLILGACYLSWRFLETINWAAWPIAFGLLAAETYSYIDACLFGFMIWRWRRRPPPPPPPDGATVDIFITCYNEPVEIVRETVLASLAVRYPHRTYVLDDGASAAMRAMAEAEGAGYIIRSEDWRGKERHAKSGNLNNALLQTDGEFMLILDADQIPAPDILDRTLGYFRDPRVSFVQTPQWFYNVPPGDPFGCQAPLFYGPIQQGKDSWNAAFFCGSNAVLRREALMHVGLVNYADQLDRRVRRALDTARSELRAEERRLAANADPRVRHGLRELRAAVDEARRSLRAGASLQEMTYRFQSRVRRLAGHVATPDSGERPAEPAADGAASATASGADALPLTAIETVRRLMRAIDVDRSDEALPVMPFATISVTEDMATAMRLHGLGWASVYHDEILARGLAPDDLRSAFQQRLRWAQGTLQVMLRENPLFVPGLALGQRLMYFMTMFSYLSGWFAPIYLIAPVLYLTFGIAPTRAEPGEFLLRLAPFLILNQLVFIIVSWGRPTWRGQQYSLALFPIWVKATTSAVGNVIFGRKLGFIVTPKVRQGGVHLYLIRPQLVAMALLAGALGLALARLALGIVDDGLPLLINAFWAGYDLVALSAVLDAVTYQPPAEAEAEEPVAPLAKAA
jgi:cellulose synthase (UDP-forming)